MPRRATEATPVTPPRLVGVDVARAIAIIGMFATHTIAFAEFQVDAPSTYGGLMQGQWAATFVLLAGISIALFTGGSTPPDGPRLAHARHLLLVRAVMIFLIGSVLQLLGTPIVIILIVYAFFFVAALPLLRTPPKTLFIAAAVMAVVMPVVLPLFAAVFWQWGGTYGPLFTILADGGFPALTWGCFFLVGLGLGRLNLSSRSAQERLAGWGAGLAVSAYALAALLGPLRDALDPQGDAPAPATLWNDADYDQFPWSTDNLVGLIGAGPYSSTPFNLVGSAGVSMLILALCLILCPRPTVWNRPLQATGRLALTNYSAHIVALFALYHLFPVDPDDPGAQASWLGAPMWAAFTLIAIVGSTAWLHFRDRGPLEGFVADVARRSAGPRPQSNTYAETGTSR